MDTIVHILNVGQGNMVWIRTTDGKDIFFDCNITDENEDDVLSYISDKSNGNLSIDEFICSHRDADHMRGIEKLHYYFPIQLIKDSDYPGTTTDSSEYRTYMRLRSNIGCKVVEKQKYFDYGNSRLRFLSAADERLASNANAQGIVIKVEQRSTDKTIVEASIMLTADSDAETWRYGIQKDYASGELKSDLIMAGHHGSLSFFDDPGDTKNYYLEHIRNMKPAMAIVSVGNNAHGHPDPKALKFYEQECSGSKKGNKIKRTDEHGNLIVTLKSGGGWNINVA